MGKTINQNEKRKELKKKIRIITDIIVFLEILSNKLGISVCFVFAVNQSVTLVNSLRVFLILG